MSNFKQFLQDKGADWKERRNRRAEWLGALDRLFAQIRDFLKDSDPEGILEIVPYEVERVESRLGLYDAPALRIRLGTESVDVVPVGRNLPDRLSMKGLLADPASREAWGDLSGGRVYIKNDEKFHILERSIISGQDRWFFMTPFLCELSRQSLEEVLQDLMS